MQTHIADSPADAARAAARRIAALAAEAIATRGRFTVALSGGTTPWVMLDVLTTLDVDWSHVHVFQVDERRAPDDSTDRNWTHIEEHLVRRVPLLRTHLHPMPVLDDPERAARHYAESLRAQTTPHGTLDLAQLGLGDDGHTASLVPGDGVLDVADHDVAWTAQPYRGSLRMTLTLPCLARARALLWLATGAGKVEMLRRLRAGDRGIPAGRLPQDRALLFADAAAVPSRS
ncbi:MAG: 6-phosphogluconolactonase [Planctomycetota bacterium]